MFKNRLSSSSYMMHTPSALIFTRVHLLVCTLLILFAGANFSSPVFAATFYVDPATGSQSNDGSSTRPWRTIQEVFQGGFVGTRVHAGDTILLRNGYHGYIDYTGSANSDYITVAAESGHAPQLRRIRLNSTSRWIFRGLTISPELTPGAYTPEGRLFEITGSSEYITIEQCTIYSVQNTSAWTATQWTTLAANGIWADVIPRLTIRYNQVKNVRYGILATGVQDLVEHNTVENFTADGLRAGAADQVFQYNTIKNSYQVDSTHRDGIQVYTGSRGDPRGTIIRGNIIIGYDNPNRPFTAELQGISLFDPPYSYITIENNIIITEHTNGIVARDAVNSKIVNNIIFGPYGGRGEINLRTAPLNTIVRNNIAYSFPANSSTVTSDHNLDLDNYNPDNLFVDWRNLNLRHKAGSPAIDAGSSVAAPSTDIEGKLRPQGAGYDIGAYEYGTGQTVNQPPVANAGPDQTVTDTDRNGSEAVTLNGSASTDSDGTIQSYVWSENGSQIATGVTANVTLTTGVHTITLTITDDDLATGTDTVIVTVQSPAPTDTTPPSILSVTAYETSAEVLFSEPVENASAENVTNYSINNGVSIISISLNTDQNIATISTTSHTDNSSYALTISNVRDLAGNILTATTINYSYNDGLAGYWKFEDANGTIAADSSGKGNNGSLINTVQWTNAGEVNFISVSDAVQIPTTGCSATAGTIAMWINTSDYSGTRYLFGHTIGTWSNRIQLYIDNGDLCLGLGDSHARHTGIESLSARVWYYIALTWNGTNYVVYVDGIAKATGSYTGLTTLSSFADIGNDGNPSLRNEAFSGIIDEVRLYNRALGENEISNLALVFLPIGDKTTEAGSELTFAIRTKPGVVVDINDHNLPSQPSLASNVFSWTPSVSSAGAYQVAFEAPHSQFVDFETITISVISTASLADGLFGYWKMNDNAATTAVADSSSQYINGTAQRNTNLLSTTGKLNGALTFNGTTDYISLADINTFDSASTPLTIAMWIKPTNFTATPYQMLLDKLDDTAPIRGFCFSAWQNTGAISFTLRSDNWLQVRGSSVLPNNAWSFVAVTYDGSKRASGITLYLNGMRETPIVINNLLTADDISNSIAARLGAREGANYPFAGAMDNVMVYSRVLSQAEIGTLYNGGKGLEININHPPVLATIGDKLAYENSIVSFSVTASDRDGDTLTYAAQNLPAGAVFSGNTFTWTPTSGQKGTHQVTFIVSDGRLSDSETITITVTSNSSLTDQLVGYWKMNDSALNITVADSSMLDIDGKAKKYTSALSTTGKVNGALTFNGTTDYISLADINTFDSAATPMTIAMWIKPTNFTVTPYQMLLDKLDDTAPIRGFCFSAWQSTGTISFTLRSDNWLQVHGSSVLPNNVWSFVAVTYDGSKRASGVTLYLNGTRETPIVANNSLTADDMSNSIAAQLGAREGANYPFAGAMDNIMIYKRALSQVEISSLYNTGKGLEIIVSPLASNTVGYWKMNDNAATAAVADSSSQYINGTAQRNTNLLSTTGKLNGALTFNGTTDYVSLPGLNTFNSATTPLTIAMWIKPTNFTATPYQMLLDKLDDTAPIRGFCFSAWQNTGTISFTLRSDNWLQVHGSSVLPNNAWSFVAVTYDGSKRASGVTLYLNGTRETPIVVNDALAADDMSNSIAAQLGAREGANYPFAGAMDNVTVFNRALSQQEITSLYNGGLGTEIE